MLFEHKNSGFENGRFVLSKKVTATANAVLDKPIFQRLWSGHCYTCSEITFQHTDDYTFSIGRAEPLPLKGESYAIRVCPTGICVTADSARHLIDGFMTLLDMILPEKGFAFTPCCSLRESAAVAFRSVHLCVFESTTLEELQKQLRLCGVLKYTHVFLEFWGMLRFDSLPELSWPEAYTKDEVRPLLQEAKDMGLELIPVFNHFGHATAGRVKHGKHVVLDQNPRLWYLFSEDGWCWDIRRAEVRALLKNVRAELCDLFGDGSYFHIGCDEAYNYPYTAQGLNVLCDFIGEIADDLIAHGRRPVMWADMLLYKHEQYRQRDKLVAAAVSAESEAFLLEHIDKRILLADWQYWATCSPVETSLTLQKAGFDVLLCPWDCSTECTDACTETVKQYALFGLMHTTWHTLTRGTPYIAYTAAALWSAQSPDGTKSDYAAKTAAVLRKVFFADGDYAKAGWSPLELSPRI